MYICIYCTAQVYLFMNRWGWKWLGLQRGISCWNKCNFWHAYVVRFNVVKRTADEGLVAGPMWTKFLHLRSCKGLSDIWTSDIW